MARDAIASTDIEVKEEVLIEVVGVDKAEKQQEVKA